MMTESRWQRNKSIPTVEEYMANGAVSFALGPIILPALYFVGPKISEEVIRHEEYDHLFRLVSTCGRLLNDLRSFEVLFLFILLFNVWLIFGSTLLELIVLNTERRQRREIKQCVSPNSVFWYFPFLRSSRRRCEEVN
jgi:Terpene synthase family 2, C-terminal metal binding